MTQIQVEKLSKLFYDGFMIKCTQGPYVDGFINDIYQHEEKGLCYSSDTYRDVPLLRISTLEIEVYQPIEDWQNEN